MQPRSDVTTDNLEVDNHQHIKDPSDHVDATSHQAPEAHHRRRRRKSIAPKKEEKPRRPQTPWEQFETHVKNIGDDSNIYARNDVKFKSSDVFQKVLDEYNTKRMQQEQKRLERLRQLEQARQQEEEDEMTSGSESQSEDELSDVTPEAPVPKAVQLRAQRGWTIIKRKIHEMEMEKKNSGSMFNWKVLKSTIESMSDMDKTRQGLYERYLYKNDDFMGPMKYNKDTETIFGIHIGKAKLKQFENAKKAGRVQSARAQSTRLQSARVQSARSVRTVPDRKDSAVSTMKTEPVKRRWKSAKPR